MCVGGVSAGDDVEVVVCGWVCVLCRLVGVGLVVLCFFGFVGVLFVFGWGGGVCCLGGGVCVCVFWCGVGVCVCVCVCVSCDCPTWRSERPTLRSKSP